MYGFVMFEIVIGELIDYGISEYYLECSLMRNTVPDCHLHKGRRHN